MVADDGVTELAVLSEGNFFGEISILNIKGKTMLLQACFKLSMISLFQNKFKDVCIIKAKEKRGKKL